MSSRAGGRQAAANRRRYRRIAPLYDLLDRAFERHYRPGRMLVGRMARGLTLEVGAGTGKNFAHYTRAARVVACDLSAAMLAQGRRRVRPLVAGLVVDDAAALPVGDGQADTVVATFVCCVQDDPGPSLAEMSRVLKPGGQALFLDYTLPRTRWTRLLMRLVERPLRVVYGIRWDHDMPRLLAAAGLEVEEVRALWGPAVRFIRAVKPLA